jgi:hypothetical protein
MSLSLKTSRLLKKTPQIILGIRGCLEVDKKIYEVLKNNGCLEVDKRGYKGLRNKVNGPKYSR